MATSTDSGTRQRLLTVAERLFAAQGIRGTSLRAITTEADANLAAVNYHFGSKDGLVAAVFEQRLGPMNAERLALLDAVEAGHARGPLPLREVVEAFLGPAFRFGRGEGGAILKLVARAHVADDPELRSVFARNFKDVAARFLRAFSRAVPGASPDALFLRVFFVVGSMCHTALNASMLEEFGKAAGRGVAGEHGVASERVAADDHGAAEERGSVGMEALRDDEVMLARLVDFAVAGLGAAATDGSA